MNLEGKGIEGKALDDENKGTENETENGGEPIEWNEMEGSTYKKSGGVEVEAVEDDEHKPVP